MFESLIETVRSFSYLPTLKSNIVSFGTGGPSSSVQGGTFIGDQVSVSKNSLSRYFQEMKVIDEYEVSEITYLIMTVYRDLISSYFSNKPIVSFDESVPNRKIHENRINKILEDVELSKEIKSHIWDIIYRGSWSFKLEFDESSRKYKKRYLQNPSTVITVKDESSVKGYLVTSKEGKQYLLNSRSIFRIGNSDLTLINDLEKSTFNTKKEEDTLIRDNFLLAGCPLYYYIGSKVKEYITKELLISVLSIKDLIQPLILLLQVEKDTPQSDATKLARNIEKLMNSTGDMATIISSGTGVQGLMNMVLHNIRVLPDFKSSMGSMSNLDLSALTRKIQEMESIQDNKKESLLISNSIPRVLFDGQSTKWDAIKSSQRLNSKIQGFIDSINSSIRLKVVDLYKETTGQSINEDQITINLFNRTDIDYNSSINNTGIIGELTSQINTILQSTQAIVQEIAFIDKAGYCRYVANQLKNVDSGIEEFFNEESINNFIQSQSSQSQEPGM